MDRSAHRTWMTCKDLAPPRQTWLCRDDNDPTHGRCEPIELYIADGRYSRLESENGQPVNWTVVYDPRGTVPACFPQTLQVSVVFDSEGQGRVSFQGDSDGLFISMLLLVVLLFLAVGVTAACRLTQLGLRTQAKLRGAEWQGTAAAGDEAFAGAAADAGQPAAPSPPRARGGAYMLAPSEPPPPSSTGY